MLRSFGPHPTRFATLNNFGFKEIWMHRLILIFTSILIALLALEFQAQTPPAQTQKPPQTQAPQTPPPQTQKPPQSQAPPTPPAQTQHPPQTAAPQTPPPQNQHPAPTTPTPTH